jgi:hypothetical protein
MSALPDTLGPLVAAAEKLVELVQGAPVMLAFAKDGAGPFQAIEDDHLLGGEGRIRRAAEQLRQRLLDHDRAELLRGGR